MLVLLELLLGAAFVWSLIGAQWIQAVICLVSAACVHLLRVGLAVLRVRMARKQIERERLIRQARMPTDAEWITHFEHRERQRREGEV